MSTTPHEKEWIVQPNKLSWVVETSITTMGQGFHLSLLADLLALPTNPWLMESSSNGAAVENNTGGNLIVDASSLVASTGNHTWWVIKQPAMLGGNTSICFDLANSSILNTRIVISPLAGFGAVNGGADGTIGARPTATDEFELNASTGPFSAIAGAVNTSYHPYTIMHSTDGQCTRVIQMASSAADSAMLFAVERVRRPITPWTTPIVAIHVRGNECINYNTLSPASGGDLGMIWDSVLGSGTVRLSGPEEVMARGVMAVDGTLVLLPIALTSVTLGMEGIWGSLFDFYAGSGNANSNGLLFHGAKGYDDERNPLWIKINDYWFPWTSAEPLLMGSFNT